MRTSTSTSSMPPTRLKRRSWSTRSSFACSGRRHLADLVQENRAAVGDLEEARLAGGRRAGERVFLVAEELRLEERLVQRRAVDLHEALVAPADERWIARAISSLPVPLSPWISTVVVGLCATCLTMR